MVKINHPRLNTSYLNYLAIRNSITYIQKEVYKRPFDGNFLRAIEFPFIGEEQKKDGKEFVTVTMEAMFNSIEELIVLGLVSDFEKIVFDRAENASGEIAKIVKKQYKSKPFLEFSEDFVKTKREIDKLSIIKAMIAPKLPEDLSRKFIEIVDLRNRLALGKRFGEKSLMSFDEIAKVLDDILRNI